MAFTKSGTKSCSGIGAKPLVKSLALYCPLAFLSHFTKIGQEAFTSVIYIESYVNRLTFLKRQPVGRVPPDLLRLKVLPAVSSLMLLADTRPPLPPVSCPPRLPFRTSARSRPARSWRPPARHRWPRQGGSRRSELRRWTDLWGAPLPCGWWAGW